MKSTEKLMDMLCQELDELAEKGQLSAGDLDTIHKLIVSKEKLLRIEELEGDLGYSEDGGWRAEGTYGNGRSYRNSYANGMTSYRRNSRGRYSRNGYSMADGKERIIEQIEEMMNSGDLSQMERQNMEKAMIILQK